MASNKQPKIYAPSLWTRYLCLLDLNQCGLRLKTIFTFQNLKLIELNNNNSAGLSSAFLRNQCFSNNYFLLLMEAYGFKSFDDLTITDNVSSNFFKPLLIVIKILKSLDFSSLDQRLQLKLGAGLFDKRAESRRLFAVRSCAQENTFQHVFTSHDLLLCRSRSLARHPLVSHQIRKQAAP